MAFGYLIVAVLATAITIFALQNGTPVTVRFLAWTIPAVSVAALALASFAIGLVIAALPLAIGRWRFRSRARGLASEVRQLQATLADRERALLAMQRPAPRPSQEMR
jgi:uncharacterized integral membrane protein